MTYESSIDLHTNQFVSDFSGEIAEFLKQIESLQNKVYINSFNDN